MDESLHFQGFASQTPQTQDRLLKRTIEAKEEIRGVIREASLEIRDRSKTYRAEADDKNQGIETKTRLYHHQIDGQVDELREEAKKPIRDNLHLVIDNMRKYLDRLEVEYVKKL